MHIKPKLFIFCLFLYTSAAFAESLEGTVVKIADGDTLTILVDQQQIKVRLSDIDAPERKQPFGARSRQHLASICYNQLAEINNHGKDRYGRVIGRVQCAGKDANAEQIRAGMAWVYDKYVTDRSLYGLQDAARSDRRGLWTDAKPVPPWEWRKGKREKRKN
jgi:endonuclease YncB( thermonuclease family)